jgi:hypothetical protein
MRERNGKEEERETGNCGRAAGGRDGGGRNGGGRCGWGVLGTRRDLRRARHGHRTAAAMVAWRVPAPQARPPHLTVTASAAWPRARPSDSVPMETGKMLIAIECRDGLEHVTNLERALGKRLYERCCVHFRLHIGVPNVTDSWRKNGRMAVWNFGRTYVLHFVDSAEPLSHHKGETRCDKQENHYCNIVLRLFIM